MNLLVSRLNAEEPFTMPSYALDGDLGLDLYASRRLVIKGGSFAQVHTNTAIALPDGHGALLLPRGSTFMRRGLLTHPGTVDNGYTGELIGLVYNPNKKSVLVKPGDRLFQLILIPLIRAKVLTTLRLPETSRNIRGFGSTGA